MKPVKNTQGDVSEKTEKRNLDSLTSQVRSLQRTVSEQKSKLLILSKAVRKVPELELREAVKTLNDAGFFNVATLLTISSQIADE